MNIPWSASSCRSRVAVAFEAPVMKDGTVEQRELARFYLVDGRVYRAPARQDAVGDMLNAYIAEWIAIEIANSIRESLFIQRGS